MRFRLFRYMCDAAERGVQLCQEAVCSDRGGECSPIMVEGRGRLAVPARVHKLFSLILRGSKKHVHSREVSAGHYI